MPPQITVADETMRRVQSLVTPLFDEDAVIGRLLDYWETGHPGTSAHKDAAPGEKGEFVLSRGERLQIGLQLRANYRGRWWTAEVTESGITIDGKSFSSPSAVARYVKSESGVAPHATHTNGWTFWEFHDPQLRSWRPLDSIRT